MRARVRAGRPRVLLMDNGESLTLRPGDDTPIEYDCPYCGTHHVIVPSEIDRLVGGRKFRCYHCGHRKHIAHLASMVLGTHPQAGVCTGCDKEWGRRKGFR